MSAKEILETALDLIDGDRANDYGPMLENHENIASLWNGYLYNKELISAEDVANMMELLKIARRKTGTLKKDNYIDGAGYAAVAYECATEEQGYADTPLVDEISDMLCAKDEQGYADALSMLVGINLRLKEKLDNEKES